MRGSFAREEVQDKLCRPLGTFLEILTLHFTQGTLDVMGAICR